MSTRQVLFTAFTTLACFLGPMNAQATHLRAGEIIITRVSCTSNEFDICITVYTDSGSSIMFGEGELNFGDGSQIHRPPQIANTPRPDLGPDIATVTYCIRHAYGPGQYIVSYREPNRNAGIENMNNSVETRFYTETIINIDPFLGCSNTPRLLVPPIDKACTGAAWFHNPGAYDVDGDSLSYELIIPKQNVGTSVNNYRPPNSSEFYNEGGLDFGTANEAGTGPPDFEQNPGTGTITWDAPGEPGEYNIAFLIIEWRKVNDVWIQIGSVTRDMQIIVEECTNQRPELEVPADLCVEAGEFITAQIFGSDPDPGDSVKIEAFSQVFELPINPADYSPRNKFQKPGLITFTWQTDCSHVKQQPYQVVFKITDKPLPGSGARLVEFKTWNITVVAPAPQWEDAAVLVATRSAQIEWEPYICAPNALSMIIYRRTDEFPFTPPDCVTGIPEFLGYTKIAEVPVNQTAYTDNNGGKGLPAGARICYRLVAAFPSVFGNTDGGSVSYVSRDTCVGPILADAPVITHVTVDSTKKANGQVTVKWRSPFDIDEIQFPPPYEYDVYRAVGFSGNAIITKVNTARLTDSTLVDTNVNSEETVYNYRIVCYDNNNAEVDTSATASTVRLEAKSLIKKIELIWIADVPWSIKTQAFPKHYIYRGANGSNDGQLVLIDSVDVSQPLLHYIDSGQYQGQPLNENEVYCYRVRTLGTYGNPEIAEPLVNYSQMICAQPNDENAPCQPTVALQLVSCEDFLAGSPCGFNDFSNSLFWEKPADLVCRADIKYYNIYFSANPDGNPEDFQLLATNVTDTFFVDNNLPSFARCYKLTAVDRSGNESDSSLQVCNDNCPNYQLPNVFTPGNNDDCNDLFSAFSDRFIDDGILDCGNVPVSSEDQDAIRSKCPRFVRKVELVIINRWGNEVYSYQSGGENTIYIDWDGRDNSGLELSSGIYFYSALVTFDTLDPKESQKVIKGWVNLIRGD